MEILSDQQEKILEKWGVDLVQLKLFTPQSGGLSNGSYLPAKIVLGEGVSDAPRAIVEKWLIERKLLEKKNNDKMQRHLYWFALFGAIFGLLGIVVALVQK